MWQEKQSKRKGKIKGKKGREGREKEETSTLITLKFSMENRLQGNVNYTEDKETNV